MHSSVLHYTALYCTVLHCIMFCTVCPDGLYTDKPRYIPNAVRALLLSRLFVCRLPMLQLGGRNG